MTANENERLRKRLKIPAPHPYNQEWDRIDLLENELRCMHNDWKEERKRVDMYVADLRWLVERSPYYLDRNGMLADIKQRLPQPPLN